MAQTNWDGPLSLSPLAKNWAETKEQSDIHSAQSSASCRRSGCSPAVPYPPHECQQSTICGDQSLSKGTFLLCRIR
jgi:hypothetical protein